MSNGAAHQSPRSGRLWLAGTLLLTAFAVSLLARMGGLEFRVYDLLQQYQYKSASDDILLVTDAAVEGERPDIWTANGFGNLVTRLTDMGARVVVATEALHLPEVPSTEQINALAELERQALRAGGETREELQRLTSQLAGFRENFDAQQNLQKLIRDSGNVLLAVQSDTDGTADKLAPGCSMHAANLQGAEPGALADAPSATRVVVPPDQICAATFGLGFNSYRADPDGVVRRTNLLTNTNGTLLPSLALAAWAAALDDSAKIVVASTDALLVGDRPFYTGAGFEILTRHYGAAEGPEDFISIPAADVLAGRIDPLTVRDRIVLVGRAALPGDTTLRTPVARNVSALQITANNLSNVIAGDYLLRPDWAPILEYALLVVVLGLVLFWLPGLHVAVAMIAGVLIAAALLGVQTWFLLNEGLWLQLAAVALFTLFASCISQGMRLVQARRGEAGRQDAAQADITRLESRHNKLDLEFSVLRQQPITDDSKERMYQIAHEHGRGEEFAKAERVLAYLAKHDPDYKDVAELLNKLSGRRQYTPLSREPEPAATPDAASSTGQTLGRYLIERKLGQGAMATVYLGTDPNIGRKVAIKTVALAQEFDEAKLEEARMQFRREAESAGRLNHPNIIAIYDAGEDGDVSYLAMEYFEGDSLLNHAQRDNLLPASWVLELMARAADALDYAHRQNVVHRDIKPANILYDAGRDELKLTDFGIARLTDSSRTKTGIILGTPSYMSPEQLTASGVTGKSDLYSLGVTTYQLLAGVAPFRADSIPKLMDKIMNTDHEPLGTLIHNLPPSVETLIRTALAKNPDERFPNGRAMAIALRDAAADFGS